MKKDTEITLKLYGIIILGILVSTAFIYFYIKYPPTHIVPDPQYNPGIYSPYPGVELERQMYLESKLLSYRRTA